VETVSLYLADVAVSGRSGSVRTILAALAVWHTDAGLASPTTSPAVKELVKGIARAHAHTPKAKRALRREDVERIRALASDGDAAVRRTVVMAVLGWSAWLRIRELLALRVRDIEFHAQGMRVFVARSKTDQLGKGAWVLVARDPDASACPVQVVHGYVLREGLTGDMHLLRNLNTGGEVSYDCARRDLRALLERIGLAPEDYGTHSLRRGGATDAAERGVSDALIKVQGRWKSAAYQRYVEPSPALMLTVTAPPADQGTRGETRRLG
jgi:integrase